MLKRLCTTIVLVCALGFWASVATPQSPMQFKSDPIGFFSTKGWRSWVGKGAFFGKNYTDSLHFSPATAGKGLNVRRVLVETDSLHVVSQGTGTIMPDSSGNGFAIRWSEKRYPPVAGRMSWENGQWAISFEGSWRDWLLTVRQDSTMSLNASVARLLPGMGLVDVAAMTYRRIP